MFKTMCFIQRYFKLGALWPRRPISTSSRVLSDELVLHRDSEHNNASTPFQFTEANEKRITALIANYPTNYQSSVVSFAIDIAQRQVGWVPIAAMHRIAELLDMPKMRVYEFCTFYTMTKRRPRGKFHVKVCVTTPCMLRGSDEVLAAAEVVTACRAGELSADGMFGVDAVQCAGACANAPIMVIDDDYYEDVTECDVERIINSIKSGYIPQPGPQSGRYAAEPISGPTTLLSSPLPPGHGLQDGL